MIADADLHLHSRFSGATSPKMQMKVLASESKKKGMHILGTGDCLHPQWIQEIKEGTPTDGLIEIEDTYFLLSTEVEDEHRVHHLLFFPSFSAIEQFRESIRKFTSNMNSDGRPNLHLNGAGIASRAKEADALIGPAHAFTPWTALYGYHDSLESCYEDMVGYLAFLELGLSADTTYADTIGELHRLSFLSNSDSHSPYPVRLAREFNRLQITDFTWDDIKKALLRQGGRKIILNVGFPPQKGKYNQTACTRCYHQYTLQDADAHKWKCSCGGRIKKGVKDRISELSTLPSGQHPSHRPPYLYLLPLAEIISHAIGQSSPYTKAVQSRWDELITAFGNEVSVLLDRPIEDINRVTVPVIADAIQSFREKKIKIYPGGGGKYGEIELPRGTEEQKQNTQKTIFDY